jgi:carnitine O-acetyltransferase
MTTSAPLKSSQTPTSSPSPSSSKPLYASQSSLPHLPIPTLSSTFSKYLETLLPLQSASERAQSKKAVKAFLDSPLSGKLQERLEARAKERDSWLSEWWNEVAYMGYRGRIIPNVSYFYTHKRGLGGGNGQEERAAELVRATVEFKKLVDRYVLVF